MRGDISTKRAAAEHYIFHHLDENTAEAKHCNRAKHRVAVNTQNAFHAPLQLLRYQNALDVCARRSMSGTGQQQIIPVANRGGIADIQQHATDLRLVQNVRR